MDVLGVPVDALTLPQAADRILRLVDAAEGAYICVRDVHGIVLCQDDPALQDIHRRAAMVTTDGMPLVRAVRRAGHPDATRVYGPDLMLEVCGRRVGDLRHLLYGSTPEVLEALRRSLESRHPGISIVGEISPPFRQLTLEEAEVERQAIVAADADIVWVGLSTPKQERWMAENVALLGGPVLVGVGAAFDFISGRKRQAPRWMQRVGLEWSFRLVTEPRRLGRRYLSVIPRFLWLTARGRVHRSTYAPLGPTESGTGR